MINFFNKLSHSLISILLLILVQFCGSKSEYFDNYFIKSAKLK